MHLKLNFYDCHNASIEARIELLFTSSIKTHFLFVYAFHDMRYNQKYEIAQSSDNGAPSHAYTPYKLCSDLEHIFIDIYLITITHIIRHS